MSSAMHRACRPGLYNTFWHRRKCWYQTLVHVRNVFQK